MNGIEDFYAITDEVVAGLKDLAMVIRINSLRMIHTAGSGHPGGSLSCAEILACLYGRVLRYDPKRPDWPERDRFILSKGHCCPALYAALIRQGFLPPEDFGTLRRFGSCLQGHPCAKTTPGLDATSGSLGNGISQGIGMALAARMDGLDYRVYVLVGDGELQEGMCWEALMAAGHFKLDSLCLIVDKNGLQVDGAVQEIMDIDPLPEKLAAFRWHVHRVNGHDVRALLRAFTEAARMKNGPTAIIADTIKGKGVSFMEGRVEWHGRTPTADELEEALAELEAARGGGQR